MINPSIPSALNVASLEYKQYHSTQTEAVHVLGFMAGQLMKANYIKKKQKRHTKNKKHIQQKSKVQSIIALFNFNLNTATCKSVDWNLLPTERVGSLVLPSYMHMHM